MIWIIIAHTFVINLAVVDNPMDMLEIGKTYYGQIFTNAYISVDSFFFIAGVLVAFLKLKEIKADRKRLSIYSWLMFYVQRILRISPAYYTLIVFHSFIFTSWLYNMPILLSRGFGEDSCRKNWWINFLYLNNFIDYKSMCLVPSWYLATDFQIYIFSPLLILPFALFGSLAGLIVACTLLVISSGTICYF
ncbi:unnamed protein product [Strongylus vulgaris]|uniref:Acyltransferase 3 domain-containing protein n=1 Tax=Strongylus vulgaris TaxID=40348 RepID=A0A3P7IPQ2_STRVU|nr:unnamed protein product [Strongylus vulgaris]